MLFGIRRGSLRTKIIAWSFVPTALILLAVALVTFVAYQQVTQDLVIERDRDLIRLSAGQLVAKLTEYGDLLSAEARTADIYGNNPIIQRTALKRAANRFAVFDGGVLILNNHGIVIAAEPERPKILGQDWADRPYFRQMLRGPRSVFSDITTDGPGGIEVIVVAVPITGDQGEFLGTIVGMFRLGATTVSAFYGGIVKLRFGQSGNAYLVDGQGRVIYHSDSDYIGDDFSAQAVVQQALSGQVDALRTRDLAGRDIVAGFAPVPGTSWGLVTEESWAALIRPSQGYRQFLIALLVLGVLIPALVVAVGVQRITRPIVELINAAQAVAGGDFGQTITASTGDEIEDLAEQFNRMSAQLQISYTHLERMVAERTRELATLSAIAAVVSRSFKLEDILRDALDKSLQVMEVETGAIYLLDEEAGVLNVTTYKGFSPQFVAGIDGLKIGEGFSGRVAQSGLPLVVKDVSTDPRLTRMVVREERLRSLACVPLHSRGKALGVLFAATYGLREFSDQEVELLTAIGQQVGVAVENSHLFRAEQRRAEQFRVISEVGRRITSILAVDELLHQITNLIQTAFDHYLVEIGLVEDDEVILKARATRHQHTPFQAMRLKVGQEGITGWVAAQGEPLLVSDVSEEPRYVRLTRVATRSELAVPITAKGKVIGVMNVESDQLNAFDETDVTVLQSLANQAGVALENARLLAAERRRADELDVLRANAADISAELELSDLLKAILERAIDLMRVTVGELGLYDEGTQEIRIVASYNMVKDYTGTRIALGEGAMGRVAQTCEPLIVQDHDNWEGRSPQYAQINWHSTLVVPLIAGGRLVGTIAVGQADLTRQFGPTDLHLLELFAQQAAIAVRNAQLYEQIQQVAVLEERQRLARDLHDSATQSLYAVTMFAEAASRLLKSGEIGQAADHLSEVRDTAQEALREMRLLIFELRPPILEKEGLVAALQTRLEMVEGRSGLEIEFEADKIAKLSPEIEEGFYRIAQESLNNILKHAKARNVTIHLCRDQQKIVMEIADDGIGFDPTTIRGKGGMGLIGMEERAALIGGQLMINSNPIEGTAVRVEVSQ